MDLAVWRRWWRTAGERELRVIAMERWNPIGVPDLPADEYDAYLGRIAVRLRDGVSTEELAAFLSDLSEYIGVESAPDADEAAASAMRAWYDSSTTRFTSELGRPRGMN